VSGCDNAVARLTCQFEVVAMNIYGDPGPPAFLSVQIS
jgi:hypothetical protein